jgi:hypothetical protein
VLFTAEGPRRTRVELEHRNLERYGRTPRHPSSSNRCTDGWGRILESFAPAAAG